MPELSEPIAAHCCSEVFVHPPDLGKGLCCPPAGLKPGVPGRCGSGGIESPLRLITVNGRGGQSVSLSCEWPGPCGCGCGGECDGGGCGCSNVSRVRSGLRQPGR